MTVTENDLGPFGSKCKNIEPLKDIKTTDAIFVIDIDKSAI
jgi:hypothetical protein